MNNKIWDDNTKKLFECFLTLETLDECRSFFEDLCTISELKAFAQRIEVAQMLKDGQLYSDIVGKTGASTATVSRVSRCLNYGAGGYNLVLDKYATLKGKSTKLI